MHSQYSGGQPVVSDDVWLPPPALVPETRRRPWLAVAVGAACLAALGVLAWTLPKIELAGLSTFEGGEGGRGTEVLVEEGVAPDGRTYRFAVSRAGNGGLCTQLELRAADRRSGSAGGGCGGGGPLSMSTSSNGGVSGLISPKVTEVELATTEGRMTLPAKDLPKGFSERRYFVVVLPPGESVSRVVGRGADGSVLFDRDM